MKKLIDLTIVQTTQEGPYDIFPEIVAIGYDREAAIELALSEMRYACCKDFGDPRSCAPGHIATFFLAHGVELLAGEDEDDVAEEMGWDEAVTMVFKSRKYLLPDTYDDYIEGGELSSSDVRRCDSWEAAAQLVK